MMASGQNLSAGLIACEEALQRLVDGKPVMPVHIGLNLSRLTASIVSLEAGFDRGYLKRSRKAHLPLLARIVALRAECNKGSGSSDAKGMVDLERKLALSEKELVMVRTQRDRVLTENIQLWERLRELELAERQSKNLPVRLHR
ncbi:hypothetical protein [Pseudomonas sp. PDM09]|jgi:hypothetical protein|uniref:hypothetical protein n=1 Tax=Pseudomonas sp. PDM09 TaxID=2769270 RepID=UPI001CE1CCD5|nr:hypothetical protein [Pseudomonas sp. PDM09]